MKSKARLIELAWIIAGGVTNAVALIGVSVVLVLLISGAGAELPFVGNIITEWTKQWTLEGVFTVFFASGIVGFILGILFGKKYFHLTRKWFSAAIIGGIPMIVCLWLFFTYAGGVQIPHEIKLADCTNSTIKVHLRVPKGSYYRVILAVPSSSTNTFSGHVNISDGVSVVTNFPVSSDATGKNCDFIHAQRDYDFEFTFDQLPPPLTSVWLRWEQAYKDRDR